MLSNKNIIILTGPTGVGKTLISLQIAESLSDIEIISADSMQIYKNMDIGTDKPSNDILKKYIHHCIDLVEPSQNYDVMQYSSQALKSIKNILSRGKKPIIVGGSGLYIKSLYNPIFKGPGKNQQIRNDLLKLEKEKGNKYLYNKLKKYDPLYAKKISENDTKRIIRALEVFQLTGKSFSSFHKNNNLPSSLTKYNFIIICIYMNRKGLYQNINYRVDKMISNGLIKEVEIVFNKYKENNNLNGLQALGYKQIIKYLNGNIEKEEAIDNIKKETRHYAKRQMSWFRNQLDVNYWINVDDYSDTKEISRDIIKIMRENGY